MLLEIFKSNKSIVGVLVVISSITLWVPGFFTVSGASINISSIGMGSVNFLFEPKWLNIILTSILIGGQALYLNYIINTHKLLKTTSHLVALFFVLLSGSGLFDFSLNVIIVANSFVLLAFGQLFRLYNLPEATSTLFNLGLYVGLATLIYSPLIVLFPLALFTLSYVRSPKGRDFIVVLIGFALPLLYWGTYLFLTDGLFGFIENSVLFPKGEASNSLMVSYYFVYTIGAISLLSFFYLIVSMGRNVVKTRKLSVVVILLLLSCLSTILLNQHYILTFLILVIPLTVLISNFVENIKKRWQRELIFLVLIAALILDYFL